VSFTRQARRSAQRDNLDVLQHATDPIERLLAGERLIGSVTVDRNRALVAACAEYGRGVVAEALGITRQAVYKRLQGSTLGQMVRSRGDGDRRSRIRSLQPSGVPPPVEPDDERAAGSAALTEGELVVDGAADPDG
jgi:hypothetical protein